MDEIVVDNVSYDPYFFLGVTPDDSLEHITKVYKKKAKLIHPDKLSKEDKQSKKKVEHRIKHFKILVACFEYIESKKKSFTNNHRRKNNVEYVQRDDLDIPLTNFDNSNSLESFNSSFERLRVNNPNDFGYDVNSRLEKVEDYENFDYKPSKIFSKNFNPTDFNKAFEYRQKIYENEKDNINDSQVIIHKTTDGFSGYNSANLGNCASVSSFNGLLIVGDNFGQSGIGYNDVNFSDYKQSFEGPKNPNKKIKVPENFKGKTSLSTEPLSSSEMKRKVESQMFHRNQILTERSSQVPNFAEQERALLSRQKKSLREKVDQDKQFILQFRHLYDDQTVNDALNNRLLTSADYQNFEDNQTEYE